MKSYFKSSNHSFWHFRPSFSRNSLCCATADDTFFILVVVGGGRVGGYKNDTNAMGNVLQQKTRWVGEFYIVVVVSIISQFRRVSFKIKLLLAEHSLLPWDLFIVTRMD